LAYKIYSLTDSGQEARTMIRHPLPIAAVSVRLLQRVIYYFIARRALLTYQRSIKHLFSETSKINLRWVRWLINGYLAITLITIILYSMILRFPQYFTLWALLIGVCVSIYIYIAAFKGLFQSTLWQLHKGENATIEEEMQEAGKMAASHIAKQKKPALSDERINEIITRITSAMEREKVYQETELTLQQLSDKLNCPSHQVSQAINYKLKKTFFDLVNGYRVEEAKRLLLEGKNLNYTNLSVGFEAGFNSKTTFNTVFKKFTGLTPTDFRDKQKTANMNV
jgi:AraC-like DNA-binding protein